MGFYARRVVPGLLHRAMQNAALQPYRARVIGAARGDVLEIGVGSGLNLPLYGPQVRGVTGLEPSAALLRRAAAVPARVAVSLLEASAEAIPLDAASIDTVVTTWTLCSIPDADAALAELRRVLRPGGRLLFVEHGLAPEPGVARWQDWLDPIWTRIAGGCHLNRRIADLVSARGWRLERLDTSRIPGPRTHTFFYEGMSRPT